MLKRALAVAGLTAAGVAIPLATAAPASASVGQCTGVVSSHGYIVGPGVVSACGWPHLIDIAGHAKPNAMCYTGLVSLKVKASIAKTACSWA
ncbi:hypothetical protein NI25_25965 [Streptomyces sp. CCM_MD2014]|nr:hypothetical protein NI25_25965 [Streptomyces sp. CCM_MD2014]